MASPGLLVYGADIIRASLRSIGAISPGETPTAAEFQDCLFTLNQMLDSWQSQRRLVFSINRVVLVTAVLKQAYSLGPGGDFNQDRPARIESYGVINQPGSSQPIEIPLKPVSDREWADLPVKNTQGALPQYVWDDGNYPLRNLNYWPIPTVNVQFTIYPWQLLNQIADLAVTLYQFPPAYARAIRYNLAMELAAEFPGDPQLMPIVAKFAADSKNEIKNSSEVDLRMTCDPALVRSGPGIYNWLTDMPAGRG